MKITITRTLDDWKVQTEGQWVSFNEVLVRSVSVYSDELKIVLPDVPARICLIQGSCVWVSSSNWFQPENSEIIFEREPARVEATV